MFSLFKKKSEPERYAPPPGSKNLSLEQIDTSYWKTDDKAWMRERKAMWPAIEPMLMNHKTKAKGLSAIKAYYLRGAMPDWRGLESWRNDHRHVDLLVFLWLHPSWDPALLRELRELYVRSDLIIPADIQYGMAIFTWSIPIWTLGATPNIPIDFPIFDGHSELLFDVMMGDPIPKTIQVQNPRIPLGDRICKVRQPEMLTFAQMASWLGKREITSIQEDFLYQYDAPMNWWYESVKDVDFFNKETNRKMKPSYYKSLETIHNFDTGKEGDTCRSQFALKLRKLLDEGDFVGEFKQMWVDVRNGRKP